jgi:hypothetical protein
LFSGENFTVHHDPGGRGYAAGCVIGAFHSSADPDQLTIRETNRLAEPNLYPVIGITASAAKELSDSGRQNECLDLLALRCRCDTFDDVTKHSNAGGVPRVLPEFGRLSRVSQFGPSNKNRCRTCRVPGGSKIGQVAAHVCGYEEPGEGHCERSQDRYRRNLASSWAPAGRRTAADGKCSRAHAVIVRVAHIFRIVLSVKGRISSQPTIFRRQVDRANCELIERSVRLGRCDCDSGRSVRSRRKSIRSPGEYYPSCLNTANFAFPRSECLV